MIDPKQTLDAIPAAGHPRIPLRARLSLLRQRIILTVRWWFRLPIDELRERQMDTLMRTLNQESESLRTALNVMKMMNARLTYYEQNVPRMRDLRREFDLIQSGLKRPNGKIELLHP